jgi:membrane protein DedA with SNARE-associated domain
MHFHIHYLLQHYGYGGIFLILMAEMIGIPFPAETTLTLAGIAWIKGSFTLVPLLLTATLGNIIGSSIAYCIGRFLGRKVIVRFGKYIGITDDRLDKADRKFLKYRKSVLLISKFVAGFRVFVPYLAGMNKMSFIEFSILNSISAFAWVTVFVLLGRYVNIAWKHYHVIMHQNVLPIALISIVIVALFLFIRTKMKKRINNSSEL